MSLETEYKRPTQIIEPESLQKFSIKYVRYINKSMCPIKIINSILDKHAKIFVPLTFECEYQLKFRTGDRDKLLGLSTIYNPTQVRKQNKI